MLSFPPFKMEQTTLQERYTVRISTGFVANMSSFEEQRNVPSR
jgi:hypothetical protein